MELVVGYNFDYLLVDGVEKLSQEYNIPKAKISFYIGSNQPNLSLGRSNSVDLLDEKKHISYIIGRGYQVTYALNGLYIESNTQIIDYVKDFIELGVNSFTISNFELIDYLSEAIPDININISTVSRIHSLDQIKSLNLKNISKIILSHSINQNIEEIQKIKNFFSKNRLLIQLELVANEMVVCDSKCYPCNIYKNFSLNGYGGKGSLKFGSTGCCSPDVALEFLLKNGYSSFIRPEDVDFYSSIGIDSLKLATRKGISSDQILNIVLAFLKKKFDGNLCTLMGDQGGKFTCTYIFNGDIQLSGIQNGKVKFLLRSEIDRIDFVNYFSDISFYSSHIKSYIEYRIDSNMKYAGYVASNFFSSNEGDIVLRNNRVIDFLNLYEINCKWNWRFFIKALTKLGIPVVIVYGGTKYDYRIYFMNFKGLNILLRSFNFYIGEDIGLSMVSLYLDNSGRIKKYYRKSINILEPKYVDQIYQNAEFFYQMKEFNDDGKLIRTKYYFRHKGLSLNNSIFSVIRNSFDEINLFTTSDNIFIDYVAFNDVMPNKQSLYFVDSRNHLIANSI